MAVASSKYLVGVFFPFKSLFLDSLHLLLNNGGIGNLLKQSGRLNWKYYRAVDAYALPIEKYNSG